jgi:hypothetical protein
MCIDRTRTALLALLVFVPAPLLRAQKDSLLHLTRSLVSFVSDAPLELIQASLRTAKGVMDPANRTFAIQVPVADFDGFNSPLQREHFSENYLESAVHPRAVFKGRVIESLDLRTPGTTLVRAKGTFNLHGVERERIIECRIAVGQDGVRVTSTFRVLLEDHAIRVPRVVQRKVAPEAAVTVDLLFRPRSAGP